MVSCVENWQTIDLTMMMFPAEMLVDYVRVKGSTNVGCKPSVNRRAIRCRIIERDTDVDKAEESTGGSTHVFRRPLVR
jgi:hypothetical protein